MIDILTDKVTTEGISESEEAEANIRKLLDTNPQHVEDDEQEVIAYEPLKEGEVMFAHNAQQSISMVSTKGQHIELPYVTSDADLIAEMTAWAEHVGCVDIEVFKDTPEA